MERVASWIDGYKIGMVLREVERVPTGAQRLIVKDDRF
jgi:hypothetical protein